MINVIYCGSIAEVADEIFLSNEFNLVEVLCEQGKVSSNLLTFCYLRNIPITEVANKKSFEEYFVKMPKSNTLLLCGFGIILSSTLLEKISAYNFHPGTLPDYKGRHPTFMATLAGESYIGVSLHKVTPKIDEGPIIAIDKIKYRFNENENDLMNKLPNSIHRLLPILSKYIKGEIKISKNVGGKYYQPVSEADKTFDSNDNPTKILQIIRAQSKYGGGLFKYKGTKYKIESVQVNFIPFNIEVRDNVLWQNGKIAGIAINKVHGIFFNKELNITN